MFEELLNTMKASQQTTIDCATILGDIRIGKGSLFGGNVWLTHPIPPGTKVFVEAAGQRVITPDDKKPSENK